MCPVGQLSDPFNQGQDEDWEDVSISGLPTEPDEPPPDDQEEAEEAAGDGDAVYDLDDWSEMERQAVTDRLREAGIPHAWDGTELHVAAEDEAPVENILDLVEVESDDGDEDDEDEPEPLDATRDQVAYDLADWDDDQADLLVERLTDAGIAYAWDEDELYVYADDEAAADEVFDKVSEAAEEAGGDGDDDDGMAGAELLGELFVAADRLQHDCEDHEGVITVLERSKSIEGSSPPYGVGAAEWKHLVEQVVALSDLLLEDQVDDEAATAKARDLRSALRPFV
jgi:hypothetical protein